MRILTGVRIAVTRAQAQAGELAEPLRALGADVVVCPLIRFEQHDVGMLPDADWIVLTSANGVDTLMSGAPRERFQDARFACVGPATERRLQDHGYHAEIVSDTHTGEALAAAMASRVELAGKKVLIARAGGGGEALPDELRKHGAEVYDVELYHAVADVDGAKILQAALSGGKIDLITFTSGSTIRYFVDSVGIFNDAVIAVIGPSTAQVAKQCGLRVDIEADPHTTAGLVRAISQYYGGMNAGK